MRMRKAARASIVFGAATGAAIIACNNKNNAGIDAKLADAPIDTKMIDAMPDAQSFDFSCLGMQPAGSGSATITLGGVVEEVGVSGGTMLSISALGSASLDACKNQAVNCNGPNHFGTTATSNGSGQWSIGPIPTVPLSSPLDAYVHMSPPSGSAAGSGDRPTNVYPAFPFTADQPVIPVITFTPQAMLALELLGQTQQQSGDGLLILAVTDCSSVPIKGATIHAQQNGVDVGKVVDASQFAGSAGGGYFVFNVPPGATTLTATFMGMTFRTSPAQIVTSVAGETTFTQIRPGP